MSTGGKKRNKRDAKKKGLRLKFAGMMETHIKQKGMNVAKPGYGTASKNSENGIKSVETKYVCRSCRKWWTENVCPLCGLATVYDDRN